MSYREMRQKPVESWTLAELKKALLTTDGIGIQIKTQALERLIQLIPEEKIQDLTNKE